MDYLDAIFKTAKKVVNAGVGGMNSHVTFAGFHYVTGGTGGEKGADKRAIAFMSGLPYIGPFVQQVEKDRMYNDYLRNKGMTWADVEYPGLMGYGVGASTIASGMNFISSNIEDLYEDKPAPKTPAYVNKFDYTRYFR